MPTPNLTPQEQRAAADASRSSIIEALRHLKRYFPHERWLGEKNRYSRETISQLDSDVAAQKISDKHLAEYIAASALLHCMDGWSFLARSLSSHIAGDVSQSLHLAYYAELRAAMSLLASEGFGIFNQQHFVVTASGACQLLPSKKRTHTITWALLSNWAATPSAADLLGKAIVPGGRRLEDWLSGFSAGVSAGLIGADFLTTWGVDIQRLASDRDARNEASYRPTDIRHLQQIDPWNSANFLASFWGAFEPTSQIRSAQIDRFLLRIILEQTFLAIKGRRRDKTEFKERLSTTLRGLGLSKSEEEVWLSFLARENDADDPTIISEARKILGRGTVWDHIQVISRSALLLRVASGSCSDLLAQALISKSDIRFWWNSLGMNRGLWTNESEPDDFVDLWADIEWALESLRAWTSSRTPITGTRHELTSQLAAEVALLSSCERVALWGTTP